MTVAGGPLAGVRALDVSHGLAGPLTTMHLADLGAEVVKLESPAGDDWREHEEVPGHPGRSRHHLQVNRGKRSICVDLTHESGRGVAEALIRRADVLVTNLRPGVPDRLGVGWDRCRALNPRLVYCDISAFGDRGPRAGQRGYDVVLAAMCGFMPPEDDPERAPRASPIPVHDTALPLLACTGILTALLERERSGLGQRVEVTMMGTAAALNAHSLVRLDDVERPPVARFSRAFFRAYRTADGWIAVGALAERLARRFCAAIGEPDLLADPRFARREDRARRADELAAIIAPRMRARTTEEWDAALAAAGVPAGPVRERDALFADPQAAALGLLESVADDELGRVTMTAPVVRLSRTPARMPFPGRHLGADTPGVLAELGYSTDAIAALGQEGTVVGPAHGPSPAA